MSDVNKTEPDSPENPAASPETPKMDEASAPQEQAETTLAEQGDASDGPDIEALQAEIADLRNRLLLAAAEMENSRKRAERERADVQRYAATGFARDMLEVSDNLRRAITTLPEDERADIPENVKALIEGVEMTDRQLLSIFERHGIREVTPQPGERFDPNLHEAMFEVSGTGQPAGTVVQVINAGYVIGDRLLRAARVGVAKADENAPKGGQVDTTA